MQQLSGCSHERLQGEERGTRVHDTAALLPPDMCCGEAGCSCSHIAERPLGAGHGTPRVLQTPGAIALYCLRSPVGQQQR